MTRNKKILTAALAATLAISGVVWAQGGPGMGMRMGAGFAGPGGERMREFIADYLGLSDAQKTQAKSIFESSKASNEATITQLKALAEQAHTAVTTGKSDAELQQIANSAGPLISQAMGNHLKAMSRFYAILTPEQKAKAEKLHALIKERIMSHH